MSQPKKICDSCGKPINGKAFQMVDENYRKQHGMFECATCHFGEEPAADKKSKQPETNPLKYWT